MQGLDYIFLCSVQRAKQQVFVLQVQLILHHHLLSGLAMHGATPPLPTRLHGVVLEYGQDNPSRPSPRVPILRWIVTM